MRHSPQRNLPGVGSQPWAAGSQKFKVANPQFLLAAFAAMMLAAGTAHAARVEGTVLDPSGLPVPAARVTLLAPVTPLAETETDAEGKYRFQNLGAGSYQILASATGLVSPATAFDLRADESSTRDLRLALTSASETVVVSASLGGTLASQSGSTVSVISANELRDKGAQNLLEVIRDVPGVAVTQAGRHGGATGLFMRGGESDYTLVMIDGIEVNQFGGDFDIASLPADGVEQVEVVRGPQSALYGSNAVSGILNIVTRQGRTTTPHFTLLAEGGSFTTRRFATGGSGLTHGLSWSYNLSRLDSGGVVANDDYRNQTAFFSLGYSRSPRRQANFHFFGNANDAGAPGPYGSDPLGLFMGIDTVTRNKQNMFGYAASYSEQFSQRFRQVVTGSVAPNRYYFLSPYGDSYSNNLRAVLHTRSEVTVSNQDFLVAGFEYNREQIKNTFITDADFTAFLLPRTSLAYFVENRWSPSRRWVVTGGVRVDNIRTRELPADAFGSRPLLPENHIWKANPRAAVAFLAREASGSGSLGATRLHSSFGTGIRPPNGFELAFTDNPALRPEKSLSFDAGIEQRWLGDRVIADATYFFNRFEDQIVTLGGSLTNLSSFTSDNLANSRAQGLETSVRVQPSRSLEFSAAYTRLNSSILALDGSTTVASPFEVGQPLLRRPANSGSFNATWSRGRLMLNLNGYARGKVLDVEPNFGAYSGLFTNKGYFLANFGFAYRLGHGVELYGRLNNFLNQKYEEAFGYPSLHLNFLAGVRLNFPKE